MTTTQPATAADKLSQSGNVTVCVPFLARTEKLQRLLGSLPATVDEVIVADNGPDGRGPAVADPTVTDADVRVLDLSHDAGIGACRAAAADAAETEYLLVLDSDMRVPDIEPLIEVLDAEPSLGAVGGILAELGQIRAGCTDFAEHRLRGGQTALVQSCERTDLEWVGGHPIARFDKLANAMLVRRECVADYAWDSGLKDKEHLDWFVHHWKQTDWEFAVCPEVVIQHDTGGSAQYEQQFRHGNKQRQQHYTDRFCEKWGYDDIVTGETRWFGTRRRPLVERVYKAIEPSIPTRYSYPIKRLVGRARS